MNAGDEKETSRFYYAVWLAFVVSWVVLGVYGALRAASFWELRAPAPQGPNVEILLLPFAGHAWYVTLWRCWTLSLLLFGVAAWRQKRFFRRQGLSNPLVDDATALITFLAIVPGIVLLICLIYSRTTSLPAELHAQRLLLLDSPQFAQFQSQVRNWGPVLGYRWWVKMGLLVLLGFPYALWYQKKNAQYLAPKGHWTLTAKGFPTVGGALLLVWIVYGGFLLGSAILDWLHFWWVFSCLNSSGDALQVRATHPDGCGGLGLIWHTALLMYCLVLVYGLFVAFLISVRHWRAEFPEPWSAQNVSKMITYVVLAPLIIVPPLSVLHGALERHKTEAEGLVGEALEAEIRQVLRSTTAGEKPPDPEQLERLIAVQEQVSKWPSWPAGVLSVQRVSIGSLAPLVLPIVMALVKRVRVWSRSRRKGGQCVRGERSY